MRHAEFQDHRISGSGDDFKGFYHKHVWDDGHLGHATKMSFAKFMFPLPKKVPHKIWL